MGFVYEPPTINFNYQEAQEIKSLESELKLMTDGRDHYAKELKELKKKFDDAVELLSIRCEDLIKNGKTILDFQAVWIRQEKDINSKLQAEVVALKEANLELAKQYGEVQAVLFDRDQDPKENSKLRDEITNLKEVLFNTRDALLNEGIGRDKLQDEVTFLKAEVKLLELYLKNTREDKEKLRTEIQQCKDLKNGYYTQAVEGWQKSRESERNNNIIVTELEQMKNKLAQVRSYLMGGIWTNNLSPDEFIKKILDGANELNRKNI